MTWALRVRLLICVYNMQHLKEDRGSPALSPISQQNLGLYDSTRWLARGGDAPFLKWATAECSPGLCFLKHTYLHTPSQVIFSSCYFFTDIFCITSGRFQGSRCAVRSKITPGWSVTWFFIFHGFSAVTHCSPYFLWMSLHPVRPVHQIEWGILIFILASALN